MRNVDLKLGCFMVAFSLIMMVWLIPAQVEIYVLGGSPEQNLGPRSFPYLMSGLIGLLGIALIVMSLRKRDVGSRPIRVPMDAKLRVAGVLAISAGYLWAMTLFGYLVPTFLSTVLLLRLFGERRWWLSLLISAGTAAFLFLFFGRVFHMLMPRGSIELFYNL